MSLFSRPRTTWRNSSTTRASLSLSPLKCRLISAYWYSGQKGLVSKLRLKGCKISTAGELSISLISCRKSCLRSSRWEISPPTILWRAAAWSAWAKRSLTRSRMVIRFHLGNSCRGSLNTLVFHWRGNLLCPKPRRQSQMLKKWHLKNLRSTRLNKRKSCKKRLRKLKSLRRLRLRRRSVIVSVKRLAPRAFHSQISVLRKPRKKSLLKTFQSTSLR